jgi:hypothetical protein
MVTFCTDMPPLMIFMYSVLKHWRQHWSVHIHSLEDWLLRLVTEVKLWVQFAIIGD